MELVPGEKLGEYVIGDNLYDVIKKLDCDYKYELRYGCSAIISKKYTFIFDDNKSLFLVETKGRTKAKIEEIGFNTKISKVQEKFSDIEVDTGGYLSIKSLPGVSFTFSKRDTDYLFDCKAHSEGCGDSFEDIKIKGICVHQIET